MQGPVSKTVDPKELSHRNFIGGVFHGTFFAASQALAEPTTILPAFVALLSGSNLLVGLMTTILLAGEVLPQLFFSHIAERAARKKPFLLFAVYSRSISWLLLGIGTHMLGLGSPRPLLILLFSLLLAFAIGGSLGGVAYMDIIGGTILPSVRGRFFALRQLLGGVAGLAAGTLVGRILRSSQNYALLFVLSGVALAVAGLGFIFLREGPPKEKPSIGWRDYLKELPNLWRRDRALRQLVIIQNLAGLHLMVLPFYAVYGRELAASPNEAVARFVLFQVAGGVLSNIFWGKISDTWGSPTVLRICLGLGAILPFVALALGAWSPGAYAIVFLFLGAAVNSRNLSFSNVLVDIAPAHRRPTYTGLSGTLTAARLSFPFLGGILIPLVGLGPVFAGVGIVLAATLAFTFSLRDLDDTVRRHRELVEV